jgi:two-component system CheB/CheR fusion protein
MVSSFLQLLQKRYHKQLDAKANEYIHFAVDGAERMKILILDLLKYSRVNTMKEEHELVDLNEVASNLLVTLNQLIKETRATIEIETLPTVLGTRTQLIQLFQNLFANAIKYRSSEAPQVKVGVSECENYWQFYVQDNGIGIDPRFYEKIFVIFQRLHHKDEYSGTGIGLAICKKIVERHEGRIWVQAAPEKGSIFYFTIKKNLKKNQ